MGASREPSSCDGGLIYRGHGLQLRCQEASASEKGAFGRKSRSTSPAILLRDRSGGKILLVPVLPMDRLTCCAGGCTMFHLVDSRLIGSSWFYQKTIAVTLASRAIRPFRGPAFRVDASPTVPDPCASVRWRIYPPDFLWTFKPRSPGRASGAAPRRSKVRTGRYSRATVPSVGGVV